MAAHRVYTAELAKERAETSRDAARRERDSLEGQVRDVAYQATTTDFWGSMELVGGASTRRLGGAFNCGKAQPGQVAAVSHGCPAALFRGVNVLNTRSEAGQ